VVKIPPIANLQNVGSNFKNPHMTRKQPFKYELEDLISEYNQDLHDEVSEKIEIKLVKDIVNGWTASIENGQAIITYKKSDYPDASFAHELLHIKYELNGLEPPMIKDNEGVTDIMPIIFNQLCHHKFFSEFYDLGFNEEEFLNENDSAQISQLAQRDLKTLEDIFKKSGEIKASTALLLPYIVLISPHDKSEKTKQYIDRLKTIGDKSFFDNVDSIIKDWTESKTLDSSLTFARLFKAANRPKVGFCLTGKDEDVIVAGNI